MNWLNWCDMPWSRSIVPAEKWQVALIKSNGAQPSFSRARYAMSYRPLPWLRRFESCDMPLICVASIAMTQWPSNIINSYDMLWPSIFINWKKFYKCVFICVPKFLKRTHPNKHSWRFLWKKSGYPRPFWSSHPSLSGSKLPISCQRPRATSCCYETE